jgi:large subunit ribosomal protein L14
LGGSFKQVRHQSDIIIAVVKQATNTDKKKSDKVRAVVVRTAKVKMVHIRFDDNAAVVINKDDNPVNTCFGLLHVIT